MIENLPFSPKHIGMLVSSGLIGFVIGSTLAMMLVFLASGFKQKQIVVKKAMIIGGILGALAGPLVLAGFF
jgi:hypothetical protein